MQRNAILGVFDKGKRKTKEKEIMMAVGNGNRRRFSPHCSWLVYWSERPPGRPRTLHHHPTIPIVPMNTGVVSTDINVSFIQL